MKKELKCLSSLFIPAMLIAVCGNLPLSTFSKEDPFANCVYATPGTYAKPFIYTPGDSGFNQQKEYALNYVANPLDLEKAWEYSKGEGTTIAIIDTGIDTNNLDFDGKILPESASFYCPITKDSQGNDVYYSDPNSKWNVKVIREYYSEKPDCILHDRYSDNTAWSSHGSSVAGTAAAKIGGGPTVGIAPEANILVLKVDLSFYAIEDAIYYATDLGVDVINMSFGGYEDSFIDGFGDEVQGEHGFATIIQDALNNAHQHNVILVAAAGNDATDYPSYPANNKHVISVGALANGNGDKLSYYTNYVGPNNTTGQCSVDILAPGTVYAATLEDGNDYERTSAYKRMSGTSFASPIVAGAACLWKELNPYGTPDQFENALKKKAYAKGEYKNRTVNVNEVYENLGSYVSNIEAGRLDLNALICEQAEYIECESISASLDKSTIKVGETAQISVDFTPNDCSCKDWIAEPQDPSIVSISDTGVVTGLKAGTTTIDILQEDFAEDALTITVEDEQVLEHDAFSVTLTPSDFDKSYSTNKETTKMIGEGFYLEFSHNKVMDQASKIQFKKNEGYLYNTSNIGPIDSIEISELGGALVVSESSTFNGTYEAISPTGNRYTFSDNKPFFKITCGGSTGTTSSIKISYKSTLPPEVLESISVEGMTTSYYVNDEFSFDGICTATYESGKTQIITPTSVSTPDMTITGERTIIVSYTEGGVTKTTSYVINIGERPTLVSITIEDVNDTFAYRSKNNLDNMIVRAQFSDDHEEIVTKDAVIVNDVDTTILGSQTIEVSYSYYGVTTTASKTVVITNKNSTPDFAPGILETTEYTFTSKDWLDKTNSWTSKIKGNDITGQGVQITDGASYSNAGAETKTTRYNVTKVVIKYSTNSSRGAGSIDVKVGSTTLTKSVTKTGGTTDRTLAYDFDSLDGIVSFSVKCSTNSIYVKSISITCSTMQTEWSGIDQATSWATYFLSITGNVCSIDGNTNINDLKNVWTTLKAEYNFMLDDAKDAFYTSNDGVIQEAKERYSLIINKYESLGVENFAANSDGAPISYSNYNLLYASTVNNRTLIIMLVSFLGISLAFTITSNLNKRKRHN